MEDWLSGLSLGVEAPVDAPTRSRLASLFGAAPAEEVPTAEDEPMGFESDIQQFFELKDWPGARLLPAEPAWLHAALATVTPAKQPFMAPPPGFETQASVDEANAVRGALTAMMGNARVPIGEKMAQISQGLIWAASSGSVTVLGAILSCRTDPNSKTGTPLEATPIHFAAFCGQLAVVDALIKAGAQVNAQDARGRTCLDWAVVGNQVSLLRRLARDGAMLGAGVSDGRCGLDYAAAIGNGKAVAELVAMGVPLDRGDTAGRTSLHWASALGRTSIVRLLLHAGANPDATSRDQSTPLHWAVAAGHGLCVAELLTGGANPGLVDRRGQRPLDVAASFGKRDLVEMLVDGGAPALESALLYCCKAGRACNAGHVETLKSLIRLGVDLNCRDENGRSAIEVVKASGGLPEMISVLSGTKTGAASAGGYGNKSIGGAIGGSSLMHNLNNATNNNNSNNSNSNNSNSNNGNNNNSNNGNIISSGKVDEKEKRFKNKNNKKKEKIATAAAAAAAAGGGGSGAGGSAPLSPNSSGAVGGGNGGNGVAASVVGGAIGTSDDDEGELSNVVHIGSLPSIPGGTLWEAIKTTMSQFGNVRQVRMTPKSTFAFVEYELVDEAVAAVTKCAGSVMVHGAPCTVSWATRRKRKGRKPKSAAEMASGNQSGVGGNGGEGGALPPKPKKKNLCNLFAETGNCSWGVNCKYSHDVAKKKQM